MEIKLAERHSEEGGFSCIMVESVDGSRDYRDAVVAIRIMRSFGMIREIGSGYYSVRQRVIRELGMDFTLDQINELGDKLDAEAQAARASYIRCNCGHTVAPNLVMNASRGTACPDCYDRMSD